MVDETGTQGAAKTFGGKVKDAVGGLAGDATTQAKGKLNQAAGTARNALGTATDAAGEWSGSVAGMVADRPLTALLIALSLGFLLRTLSHTSRR